MNNKRITNIIIVLLILTVLKGILFATIVPKWEIPDENRYYKNMELLTKNKVPYFQDKSETGHPVLYEVVMLPIFIVGGFLSLDTTFVLIRFAGVAMLALIVYFTFLVSKELFPRNHFIQILAPMLVGLNPQFGFIAGSVNSEGLLALLFSALIYFLVKARRQLDTKTGLYILALLIAGLLTKERFIVALPLVLSVFAYKSFVYIRTNKKELLSIAKQNISPPGKLIVTIPVLSITGILIVLIFSRLMNLFGNYLGHAYILMPHNGTNTYMFASKLFKQFWGSFGWLQIPLPRQIYAILAIFVFLALVGIGLYRYRSFGSKKVDSAQKIGLFILALAIVITLALVYIYELRTGASQGSYLFIAMLPIAVILAAGMHQLISRFGKLILSSIFVGLVGLNIYSLVWLIFPFYH